MSSSKLIQALHSRTVWTIAAMLIFNLLPSLNISPELKDLINAIFTAVAGYFHMNPSQVYAPAGSAVTQETSNTVVVTTPTISLAIPPSVPPAA
jgi:hypothetical protein